MMHKLKNSKCAYSSPFEGEAGIAMSEVEWVRLNLKLF